MLRINPTYRSSKLIKTSGFLLLFLVLFSIRTYSQANIYVLKAVYLEKFSRFITWPEECEMDNLSKPFVIGVIGKTPLHKNLEQIYAIQKINNKKVEVRKINDLYEIKDVHLLFIAETEKRNLQNILVLTERLPVLTVSETENFAEKGVLINFYEKEKKLHFEINETAVLKSPLQMSFYLLNSAKIVKPVKANQ